MNAVDPFLVWAIVNEKSGGYNKTGIFLAALAIYELATRPSNARDSQREHAARSPSTGFNMVPWLSSAIALGSLIFTLHSLLSDSSTLIAWSWTGFGHGRPNGPVPNLHGACTLIAQSIGLLMAVSAVPTIPHTGESFLTHPLWLACGAGSTYVLYTHKNWYGYAGGLGTAIVVMSITPHILHRASLTENAGKTFFTAWLVVCLFDLAHVWVVAYAFVPGGIYLRERTDL
jgi:hypothetical protein